MKVLVVEDDAAIAHWLRLALAFQLPDGAEVSTATGSFDLLSEPAAWVGVTHAVLDLSIPGLDVPALVKRLSGTDIRVVVYSAVAKEDMPEEILAAADAIVIKPAPIDAVARAVTGW